MGDGFFVSRGMNVGGNSQISDNGPCAFRLRFARRHVAQTMSKSKAQARQAFARAARMAGADARGPMPGRIYGECGLSLCIGGVLNIRSRHSKFPGRADAEMGTSGGKFARSNAAPPSGATQSVKRPHTFPPSAPPDRLVCGRFGWEL